MIFKFNVEYANIEEIIEIFKNEYDILFLSQSFYVARKDDKKETSKDIRKKLNKYENLYIQELNEQNLQFENKNIQDWCRDHFVQQDLKRFEKEQQPKITEMLERINQFDRTLGKILERKEGLNGRRTNQEKKRKTTKKAKRRNNE